MLLGTTEALLFKSNVNPADTQRSSSITGQTSACLDIKSYEF